MKKGEREIKEEYQEGAGNPSPESALCLREISVIGESSWGISGGFTGRHLLTSLEPAKTKMNRAKGAAN